MQNKIIFKNTQKPNQIIFINYCLTFKNINYSGYKHICIQTTYIRKGNKSYLVLMP